MIKDNQLFKALQLFANKSKKNRVTDRVAHIENGLLTITDAHKLIQKRTWLPDMDIDLFNLSEFKGNYLDDSVLSRLTKTDGLSKSEIDSKTLAYLYCFVKNHKHYNDMIHLKQSDHLLISAYTNTNDTAEETAVLDPISQVSFEYIFSAPSLFAVINYLELIGNPVTLYTKENSLTPVVLCQKSKTNIYENAKIVLAPLRVF